MSHTPGPWVIDGGAIVGRESLEYAREHGQELGGTSKYVVATYGGLTAERIRSNARLIAAAPRMLAALNLAYSKLADKAAREEIGALLNELEAK